MQRFKNFLCVVEPENGNKMALERALTLAKNNSANPTVINFFPGPGMNANMFKHNISDDIEASIIDSKTEQLKFFIDNIPIEKTGELIDFLKPKKNLIKGFSNKVIPEFTKKNDADLVILGTIGNTGIPGLIIDNTAEDIFNQIHCSVLAVKPSAFFSPVTLKK